MRGVLYVEKGALVRCAGNSNSKSNERPSVNANVNARV